MIPHDTKTGSPGANRRDEGSSSWSGRRRLLITAGPTHEPIDAVRYIGNRSSGRMGVSLAEAGASRGWTTTLLLGPTIVNTADPDVTVHRFRTCDDLRSLLGTHAPMCDVLVMAAAVADYRPVVDPAVFNGKFRRTSGPLTLTLESTPDLIAEVSATRRAEQLLVGFALEPRAEVLESAKAKLRRKKIDLVVGNPLETMDSPTIEAVIVDAAGTEIRTPGTMDKRDFAPWLLEIIERSWATRNVRSPAASP
jgi:phosphopantothenoylcysteine decarboxylase / phosphopantothenate---cysteine ligase